MKVAKIYSALLLTGLFFLGGCGGNNSLNSKTNQDVLRDLGSMINYCLPEHPDFNLSECVRNLPDGIYYNFRLRVYCEGLENACFAIENGYWPRKYRCPSNVFPGLAKALPPECYQSSYSTPQSKLYSSASITDGDGGSYETVLSEPYEDVVSEGAIHSAQVDAEFENIGGNMMTVGSAHMADLSNEVGISGGAYIITDSQGNFAGYGLGVTVEVNNRATVSIGGGQGTQGGQINGQVTFNWP